MKRKPRKSNLLHILLRILSTLACIGVIALKVVAIESRPVVGPNTLEHLTAMFIVGALFQSAWRFSLPTTAIILVAFTAGAEALQLLTDTRHARVLDFGVDTTGALAGALIVSALLKHSSPAGSFLRALPRGRVP